MSNPSTPAASHYGDKTVPLQGGRPAPLTALIRVEGANAEPDHVRLDAAGCIIGSAPGCDIVIADRAVSRQHLELVLAPEGVSVRDLGSRNGTFFHGQRIEKMVLGLGARLQVGTAMLSVELDSAAFQAEGAASEREHAETEQAYRGIVGHSAASRKLFSLLRRLEGSLATVLIEGESGVGKERVASAVHEGSQVAEGPYVAVNCGAFPRELVASELFGHRRGAFSGAFDDRRGAFSSADGGTLLLDEIGELPLELQPMLLRALELGEVRALGEDRPKQVKVRVIAATNRDLEAAVREGSFRQDLFYRLAVVRLAVPPLRERSEDIIPLARHFAAQAGLDDLPEATLAELATRSWPGNARELKNAVASYAALGLWPERSAKPAGELEQVIEQLVDVGRPFSEQKEELLDAFTRRYLSELLTLTHGNQSEAARISGLNRTYLGRILSKYGFDVGHQKTAKKS